MSVDIENILNEIDKTSAISCYGKVSAVKGLLLEAAGFAEGVSVGDFCFVHTRDNTKVPCEVIGFSSDKLLLMPFSSLDGIGPGNKLELTTNRSLLLGVVALASIFRPL